MSNIVLANAKVPAHLVARIGQPSSLSSSIAAGISSGNDIPRISIKGARFRIVDGGTETVLDRTALDVIIVGANPKLSKTYYAAAWDKDAETTAPDCYSLNGIRPDPDSTSPQNHLCATCPHNAWGSKTGPQGQKLKACTDQKRLAIVSADDPSGPIYLLQVTPAALKGLNAYHKELSVRGIPAEVVRTRISFDTDASFPKLKFGFGGFLDEDTYAAVEDVFGSPSVIAVTGEATDEDAAPSAVTRSLPTPTANKNPLVQAAVPDEGGDAGEDEDDIPLPKSARGFGATKPASVAPKAKPTAKAAPKPKSEPGPATEVNPEIASLADEIAALMAEDADDE